MAAAFLLTVVVFFHGMNRHLDDAFLFATIDRWHRGLLLIDIFTFVIEAGILVVMANTISTPAIFLIWWTVLLAVDVVWNGVVYFLTGHSGFSWIANNIAWAGVAWGCWLFLFPHNAVYIAATEALRSAVDYVINWDLYFPRKGQRVAA